MSEIRSKSWDLTSRKTPQILKDMIGLSFSEVFEKLQSAHPITIINFYASTVMNFGINPENILEQIGVIAKDYCSGKIDFDELKYESEEMLNALRECFEKNNISNAKFKWAEYESKPLPL
jgi:hypothetical protein